MILFTTGLGLLLSIEYINFDDSRSLIGIFLLALQYITPVFYPIQALGPHTQKIIRMNPLTSFLQVFRDVYGNNSSATIYQWVMMCSTSIAVLIFGLYIFGKAWPKAVAKI
jgi:ABC-type polysaccharide/polyol phosphate export permease